MEKKGTKIAYFVALAVVVVALVIAKVTNDGSGFVATGWALFPPVVAIALALISKEVYSSLFLGCVAAALLLARPLSLIFVSKEPALLPVTIRAFSIYSLSFLMAGHNIYASSFFTALNDGFISALISFARTLVFQVAAVTVLPVLWDIDGVWAAVVAAETLALLLSAACLVGKRKKYGYA